MEDNPQRRKKVLVIDDSNEDNETIKNALYNLHFEFELASDLAEGVQRTKSFDPKLILLDVRIPPRFGIPGQVNFDDILDFIRRVKDKRCVVILTGHVNDEELDQAMLAGACDYIDKDKVLNRAEFERLILRALKFHDARASHDGTAEMLYNQVVMRAMLDTIRKMLKLTQEKQNITDDKKLDLLKVQIREITTLEVTNKVTADVTAKVTEEVTDRVTQEVTERVTAQINARWRKLLVGMIGTAFWMTGIGFKLFWSRFVMRKD